MSTTLLVQDGHIVFASASGLLATVQGNRKCAQDLAESLLQDYDAEQNYGSFLKDILSNQMPGGAQELLVRHYVAEAVKLLEQKQQDDPEVTPDEKIERIEELVTATDDTGLAGFYVRVSTQDDTSAEATALSPVSLQHLDEDF
jgi:hypothetical protein